MLTIQSNSPVGVFDLAMGTNVFFSEDPNPPPMDANFETIPSTVYRYHSQTDKVLRMERIFITPKEDNDEGEEEEDEVIETQSDEDVIPNESYLEALNHFLKPGELPPRVMSNSDIIMPIEFQTYFRPQLNQVADEEQSEGINDSVETSDNNDRTETNATSASEAGKVEPMEISLSHLKIETIKQEQQ